LKNRLKKIKNSSMKATLNYLFFEKLLPTIISKNTIESTKNTNGFPATLLSSKLKLFTLISLFLTISSLLVVLGVLLTGFLVI